MSSDGVELVLGTAQLGSAYGVTRESEDPAPRELLPAAVALGIRSFDTAPAYGRSEQLLGEFVSSTREPLRIVTKLDPQVVLEDPDDVRSSLDRSVERLGQAPDVVLVHQPEAVFDWSSDAAAALMTLVSEGLVGAIGVSVYTPEEFSSALDHPEIRAIQAPLNAFDRRLVDTGLLERARETEVEVFLRSVLLQGLLGTSVETLPPTMEFASAAVGEWLALCREHSVEPADAALRWAGSAAAGHAVVIGCQTVEELQSNAASLRGDALAEPLMNAISDLRVEARVIDPRRWN